MYLTENIKEELSQKNISLSDTPIQVHKFKQRNTNRKNVNQTIVVLQANKLDQEKIKIRANKVVTPQKLQHIKAKTDINTQKNIRNTKITPAPKKVTKNNMAQQKLIEAKYANNLHNHSVKNLAPKKIYPNPPIAKHIDAHDIMNKINEQELGTIATLMSILYVFTALYYTAYLLRTLHFVIFKQEKYLIA